MIKFIASNLFGFEREETAGEILGFRIVELFLLYMGVYYAWTWGWYIPRISEVVLPLGIAAHLDISFMFNEWVSLTNAFAITLALVAGYFRLHRAAWLVGILLLHLQYVSRFSLGEISHGSNLVAVSILAVALASLAFRERRNARRAAMGLIFFFIGIGYTSAATCKLVATGPQWVDGIHLWMWIWERKVDVFSTFGVLGETPLQTIILDSRPVATLILTFGLLTELFGFLLWFRRSRLIIGLFLVMMHLGIVASMQISFNANTLLVALIAIPLPQILDRTLGLLDSRLTGRIEKTATRFA